MGNTKLSAKGRARMLAEQKQRWAAWNMKRAIKSGAIIQTTAETKEVAKAEPQAVMFADLTVPQLGEVVENCDRAIQQHEVASGAWGTLQGLALMVAKARLKHGEFMPFVQGAMKKNHKQATRRMRLGTDFLKATKMGGSAQFAEAQRLLTKDLGKILADLDQVKLDLRNPVVKAIVDYTEGKSLTQLLLDLGPSVGHQVHTPARKERRTKEEIDEAYARGQWDDELKGELGRWLDEKLYERLDDQRLVELHDILLGLAPAVRELKAKRHLK